MTQFNFDRKQKRMEKKKQGKERGRREKGGMELVRVCVGVLVCGDAYSLLSALLCCCAAGMTSAPL